MENQTTTEAPTIKNAIGKSIKSIIIIGVLILILGILAVVYPEGFGKFSVMTLGVFMVIGGVLRLFFAIFTYSMGSMFMRYLYGLLMIFAGIWLISNPEMGLGALTVVMAAYFIIDGATEIGYSFSLMPIGGGFYLLMSGIVSVIIGILIYSHWPESSNYVLGIYIGVKLIIDGLMLALTGKALQKVTQ